MVVSAENCVRRDYGRSSFVCVCNATYCDTAPSVGQLTQGQAIQITSSRDSARFQTTFLQFGMSENPGTILSVLTQLVKTYISCYISCSCFS